MITSTKAWSHDGQFFQTLEAAQAAAIAAIIAKTGGPGQQFTPEMAADALVKSADKVVDILTTNERSLPKARRINGGSKSRKPKTAAAPLAADGQLKLAAG